MNSEQLETPLEHVLTSQYKTDMIAYMHAHPEAFDEAIALALAQKQPYSWRAAWLLWSCMEENDTRVRPYVKRIIRAIPATTDNHRRELCMILQRMEVEAKYEGLLFDACLAMWQDIHARPSVRVNALKLIVKIARGRPELRREIALLTQSPYTETFSPAVKKAIPRIMKELEGARRTPRPDRPKL
jgi:hypothetical protein